MKSALWAAVPFFALSASFAEEPKSAPAEDAAVKTETPAASAAPAAAETKAAPAPPAAAAAQPTVDKSDIVDKAATEKEIKTMRARGYKPVNRNGKLVYCRSEGEIGTHFEKTRCNTMDELRQAELTGKDYVNSIQQQGSPTPFKGDGPGR